MDALGITRLVGHRRALTGGRLLLGRVLLRGILFRGVLLGSVLLRRLLLGRRAGDLDVADQVTLGDTVAFLHRQLHHLALERTRHVHGGLVGLQGDQGVLDVHLVTFADGHLDDRHVAGTGQVGDTNLLTTTFGGLVVGIVLFLLFRRAFGGLGCTIIGRLIGRLIGRVVIAIIAFTGDFHGADDVTFGDGIPFLDVQADQLAGVGARHVHGGLVGLQGDQGVFLADLVAFGHRHLDDLDVAGATQVRHLDLDGLAATAALLLRCRLVVGLGRFLLVAAGIGLRLFSRIGVGVSILVGVATTFGLDLDDVIAFRDGVAFLDQNLEDLAALGRRHVHAGLVGFQGNQGVFRLDHVTFGHRDFDDFHIGVTTDIGHFDDFATQGRAPSNS